MTSDNIKTEGKIVTGPPSLGKQIVSFGKAAAKQAIAGNPRRTEEEVERLKSICAECEFFMPAKIKCMKCGCSLNVKERWATASCPIGKWDMISVIIASRNEQLLNKTIDNVLKNAGTAIEFVIVLDGDINTNIDKVDGYEYDTNGVIKLDNIKVLRNECSVGRRKAINQAVNAASGKYLFHLDGHCTMSKGWGKTLLFQHKEDNSILVCTLRSINENFEFVHNVDYRFCRITPEMKTMWWLDYAKRVPKDEMVSKGMSFTGCGWFLSKDYYNKIGGFDERLGGWGNAGSELSLKVWLSEKYPGSIYFTKSVVCGHLFRKKFPYKPNCNFNSDLRILKDKYKDSVYKLVDMFSPVPEWTQ